MSFTRLHQGFVLVGGVAKSARKTVSFIRQACSFIELSLVMRDFQRY